MSTTPRPQETANPKTGMTHTEMREFVRNHFEEFVNRKNLNIGKVNFAPEFVDHGGDVPPALPLGPEGAMQYVGGAYEKFPDLHVDILDMIAEDDRVVVRNHWTGTEAGSGTKYEFSGIVIWRIAHRQLVERWAYLQPPSAIRSQDRWNSSEFCHSGRSPDACDRDGARNLSVIG